MRHFPRFMKSVGLAIATKFLDIATASIYPIPTAASKVPAIYLDKVGATPNLMQSLPEAKLPWNGAPHCGPVAVSNSMIWLGKNGYERLSLPGAEKPEVQGQLVQ